MGDAPVLCCRSPQLMLLLQLDKGRRHGACDAGANPDPPNPLLHYSPRNIQYCIAN
jgi:hypothetical protein